MRRSMPWSAAAHLNRTPSNTCRRETRLCFVDSPRTRRGSLSAMGGEERPVADIAIQRPGPLPGWRISPTGDRLAYVNRLASPPAKSLALHGRTLGRNDDQLISQVLLQPDSLTWTADGRRIVFGAASPSGGLEFRQYEVETGTSTVVLDSRNFSGVFPQDARSNVRRCSLATDQSLVVCGANTTRTERYAWASVTLEAVLARLGQR